MPLISIVVPVYNVEKYIGECLESILSQSYKDIEVIIVNDGSTDNSAGICERYLKNDKRVRLINKKNEGLVAARKTGVTEAKGEYIGFVDGDDIISSDYYNRLHSYYEHNPDVICCGLTTLYEDSEKVQIQSVPTGVYKGQELDNVLNNMNCFNEHYYEMGIFPSTCTKLYRTSLIKQYINNIPDDISLGEDAALTFPALLKVDCIVVDNDITGYFYRCHSDQMTQTFNKRIFIQEANLIDFLLPFYREKDRYVILRQLELYRVHLIYLATSQLINDDKCLSYREFNVYFKSIKAVPIFLKVLKHDSMKIPLRNRMILMCYEEDMEIFIFIIQRIKNIIKCKK